MTLELDGQKIVVVGGEQELDRRLVEVGATEGAGVIIWMREWKGDVSELQRLLRKVEAQVIPPHLNGASPRVSLWRETMRAQTSYW
jgi:Fe2+ transport system protein FeoA